MLFLIQKRKRTELNCIGKQVNSLYSHTVAVCFANMSMQMWACMGVQRSGRDEGVSSCSPLYWLSTESLPVLELSCGQQAGGACPSLFPTAGVTDTATPQATSAVPVRNFFKGNIEELFVIQCLYLFFQVSHYDHKNSFHQCLFLVSSFFFSNPHACATVIRCGENYYIVTGNGFCDSWWEIKQADKWTITGKRPYLFWKAMDQDINDHHLWTRCWMLKNLSSLSLEQKGIASLKGQARVSTI